MLHSAGFGTMRVHQRLKAGRAIALCWMAKAPSSARLRMLREMVGALESLSADRPLVL